MNLSVQFLFKKTLEVECPHCHEMVVVHGQSQQKQELGDTHPVLKVNELLPEKKAVVKTKAHSSLSLKVVIIILVVVIMILVMTILKFPTTPPARSAINIKNTPVPLAGLTEIPEPSDTTTNNKIATTPKKKKYESPPVVSAVDTFTLPVEKIMHLSESFQMSELYNLKPALLKFVDEPISVRADIGYKLAIFLMYFGVHENEESYLSRAEALVGSYTASVKNLDYNIYQSLRKVYKKDYSQALMFASAATQLSSKSFISQALLRYTQYLSGRENTLPALKALYQSRNFYPAGDFLFHIYRTENNKQDAIMVARSLLRQHPEDRYIKRRLADIFFELENYKDATTLYESLSKRPAALWEDYYDLARSLRRQKKLAEARTVLNDLLQRTNLNITPEGSLLIQLERGWVEYDDRRFLESTRYFEVALHQNPKKKESILALSDALVKSGRFATAGQVLEKGRELYPSDSMILRPLFSFYVDQKKLPEATKLAELMQVLKVADPQILTWLETQKKTP